MMASDMVLIRDFLRRLSVNLLQKTINNLKMFLHVFTCQAMNFCDTQTLAGLFTYLNG